MHLRLMMLLLLVQFASTVFASSSQTTHASPGQAQKTRLFTVSSSHTGDRVEIHLPAADADGVLARYLYQPSIAGGLGANGIGLDRALTGKTQLLVFRRRGNTVLAEFENTRFRAINAEPGESEAVANSFVDSTVWSAPIHAKNTGVGVKFNLSGFLQRDVLNIAERLKQRQQGSYKLSSSLSYLQPEHTQVFPDNVEFQTVQTFVADTPGNVVGRVSADARALSFSVHHSFIRLPEPGFETRPHDPRTGTSAQVLITDFAAPLTQPVVSRLARRFRLQKVDPSAPRSAVVKPIVYYMDRAAPQDIRNALMEGARWWAQAFDAAGFIDAFRVELLPEDVNPADARYNVINWVHRESRGWSTGTSVVDPRTGEIVRGVVQLGSLRVRQDQRIFQGLLGLSKQGTGAVDDPIELAYARLRQLAAHEVGHTLGLAHNFAASSWGADASVMDYPAPALHVRDGHIDASTAYAQGIGRWDQFAINWLYRQFPADTDSAAALDAIARQGIASGYRFVSDADTASGAHPYAAQWDNGSDAVDELQQLLAVRQLALSRLGPDNLPDGAAMVELQRTLVPIYLLHRYQLVAAAKLVGGVDYHYALKGDGSEFAQAVPAAQQRRAVQALLTLLQPAQLDLPESLLSQLSSAQSGVPDFQHQIELFPSRAGSVFDLPSAAEMLSDIVLQNLLAPERLNRVLEQARRDSAQLTLSELLDTLSRALAPAASTDPRHAELQRRVRTRYVSWLATLTENARLSSTAQAAVQGSLRRYGQSLRNCSGDSLERDHCSWLAGLATGPAAGLKTLIQPTRRQTPPPGAPIGEDCWFCEPAVLPQTL